MTSAAIAGAAVRAHLLVVSLLLLRADVTLGCSGSMLLLLVVIICVSINAPLIQLFPTAPDRGTAAARGSCGALVGPGDQRERHGADGNPANPPRHARTWTMPAHEPS